MKRSTPDLQAALLAWYDTYGRARLPWRATRDPYRVVVSEFMLQQTQVDRVAAAYERFVDVFPSFTALATAMRADVVRAWKGLGYNLRAVRLHELAGAVAERYGGTLPSDEQALLGLPGIGPYTASAIRAFAFELDDVAIDVNVRRVVHRLRFGIEYPPSATSSQLDAAARRLLPQGQAHRWNSALMDLGATVCRALVPRCDACPLAAWCLAAQRGPRRIAEAAKQRRTERARGPQSRLPFEQTRRYLRGRILDRLREAPEGVALAAADLVAPGAPAPRYSMDEILRGLERDGLIVRDASGIKLR